MRIIPVLDLKGGHVVRAIRGERDNYRPMVTPLAAGSDPVEVTNGLRGLYDFPTFYLADLDAIAGGVANRGAVARLRAMDKPPELWTDAGLSTQSGFEAALAEPMLRPVMGTESQADHRVLETLHKHPRLILSLDFFADGFRGPPAILEQAALWPQTVIVMTLARIGAAAGPDLERLAEIKARAGGRTIVAAGGVRNADDLRGLAAMGIQTALIATSLHDGTLTAAHLHELSD